MRAILPPLIMAVVGVPILIALCLWQVQRLEWKEGLIADIETRLALPAVPLPANPDPERDRLLRVRVTGWMGLDEIHVLSAMKKHGPGFRVITWMDVHESAFSPPGKRIMVDLGFVPERMKSTANRPPTRRLHKRLPEDTVIGFLYWPDETDSYTPEPDEKRDIWFARDVDAMARKLGTEPVLVIAESHSDGDWPLPRPPGVDLPNNHLQYALTWGLMALTWAVMSLLWARSRLRGARPRHRDTV